MRISQRIKKGYSLSAMPEKFKLSKMGVRKMFFFYYLICSLRTFSFVQGEGNTRTESSVEKVKCEGKKEKEAQSDTMKRK